MGQSTLSRWYTPLSHRTGYPVPWDTPLSYRTGAPVPWDRVVSPHQLYHPLLYLASFFVQMFDSSLIFLWFWWKSFSLKKFKIQTEHVRSLHITASSILPLDPPFRAPWRWLLLWWALWRRRLLLWLSKKYSKKHVYNSLIYW